MRKLQNIAKSNCIYIKNCIVHVFFIHLKNNKKTCMTTI